MQEPIIQPDGSLAEVAVYSGNAWRGQLRDEIASYMLDALGRPELELAAFHLLYAGGSIHGTQVTRLDQARNLRAAIPAIALLGGGVGNQVLPGKLRVSNFYPWCAEAPPSRWPNTADMPPRQALSFRQLTTEKSFSRKDDAKDERYNHHLHALPEPGERSSDEAAQQMRMTVELLVAGTHLTGHLDVLDVSDVELGCLVSGIHRWSQSPHIGGQANRGHGEADLEMIWVDLDTGESGEFLRVSERCLLAPPAEAAKEAYDQHLRTLYDALLSERGGEIKALLGAA